MKTIPLKLDDEIFDETEKVVSELHLARNRYINFDKVTLVVLPATHQLIQQICYHIYTARSGMYFKAAYLIYYRLLRFLRWRRKYAQFPFSIRFYLLWLKLVNAHFKGVNCMFTSSCLAAI